MQTPESGTPYIINHCLNGPILRVNFNIKPTIPYKTHCTISYILRTFPLTLESTCTMFKIESGLPAMNAKIGFV
jgi:hypothetical protein